MFYLAPPNNFYPAFSRPISYECYGVLSSFIYFKLLLGFSFLYLQYDFSDRLERQAVPISSDNCGQPAVSSDLQGAWGRCDMWGDGTSG